MDRREIVRIKISFCLVPWKDIPENVKEYDRKAVRDWPAILKEVGLETYQAGRTCVEIDTGDSQDYHPCYS